MGDGGAAVGKSKDWKARYLNCHLKSNPAVIGRTMTWRILTSCFKWKTMLAKRKSRTVFTCCACCRAARGEDNGRIRDQKASPSAKRDLKRNYPVVCC